MGQLSLNFRTNSCKSAVPPNLLPKQSLLRAQSSPRALTPHSASFLLGIPFRSLLIKCYSLILRCRDRTVPDSLRPSIRATCLRHCICRIQLTSYSLPYKKLNSAARGMRQTSVLQMREQMITTNKVQGFCPCFDLMAVY